eukprot:801352-Lingulodinium_polyedra.AAC.1
MPATPPVDLRALAIGACPAVVSKRGNRGVARFSLRARTTLEFSARARRVARAPLARATVAQRRS